MIACFLSNISAKYYKNPSMLSQVIAKNVGDVFFETQCSTRNPAARRAISKLMRAGFLDINTLSSWLTDKYTEAQTQRHTALR